MSTVTVFVDDAVQGHLPMVGATDGEPADGLHRIHLTIGGASGWLLKCATTRMYARAASFNLVGSLPASPALASARCGRRHAGRRLQNAGCSPASRLRAYVVMMIESSRVVRCLAEGASCCIGWVDGL